jgi:hypothetical protein
MLGYGILTHADQIGPIATEFNGDLQHGVSTLGRVGLLLLFLHAYSLGGGTYTGIEAVSNGIQMMREPRVKSGKRTMLYLSTSLALTAGGIFVCYLLLKVRPVEGQTLNAVLAGSLFGRWHWGGWLALVTILSEGAFAFCRRPDRLYGWSTGDGKYGHRFLVSASICRSLRTADHVQRHFPDGWKRPIIAGLYQRINLASRRDVLHQCLCDLLPLRTRDVEVLYQEPQEGERVEETPSCPHDRVDPLSDDPDHHDGRKIFFRGMAHSRFNVGGRRDLLPDPRALFTRQNQDS